MRYYPICVNIENRPCVVIGGGDVGERKVIRLLECGARVTVVSRTLAPALRILWEEERIRFIDADYHPEHLEGAFLVIGATDQEAVNDAVSRDCRSRGIMVNIVDDPARCDFILPAICERGDLTMAVSTDGKSPALAKKIRRELEQSYGPEYAVLVKIMGDLRDRVIAAGRPSSDNRVLFEALLDSPLLDEIRKERWDEVRRIIHDAVGVDPDLPEGG